MRRNRSSRSPSRTKSPRRSGSSRRSSRIQESSLPDLTPLTPSTPVPDVPSSPESFFSKYKVPLVGFGIFLFLGLVIFLIIFFVKKGDQGAPPGTLSISSFDQSDFNTSKIPLNTQFIPNGRIDPGTTSITFGPDGSAITGKYFGISKVADVLSVTFSVAIDANTDMSKFKATLNYINFQDYCSIYVIDPDNNTTYVTDKSLSGEIKVADSSAPISTPLSVGNTLVGKQGTPTPIKNLDLTKYFKAGGHNDVFISYGVIGSGNISFQISFKA